MNEEKIRTAVDEALNADEFDVIGYIQGQAVATDSVAVYVNVAAAKRLRKLVEERRVAIAARRALGDNYTANLGLDEAFEDTEYDDEINALVDELESTAIIFELQSLAPSLVKAIEKSYIAKADKRWSAEEQAKHDEERLTDILTRTIASVRKAGGPENTAPWDKEKLNAFEAEVYPEEFNKLVRGMYEMVYTGTIFEEALNADFS